MFFFFFLILFNAVDCQGWIFTAYPKGGVSWKKSYAMCMVKSPWYYSFWVFKLQSDSLCRFIHSTTAMCEWKSKKTPPLVNRRNVLLLHDNVRLHLARIMQEKIAFRLVYSTPSTIFTRRCTKWFPFFFFFFFFFFLFSTKCSDWEKNFLPNIRWKCLLKTFCVWISFSTEFYLRVFGKLPDKWQEVIQNNGEYIIDWI